MDAKDSWFDNYSKMFLYQNIQLFSSLMKTSCLTRYFHGLMTWQLIHISDVVKAGVIIRGNSLWMIFDFNIAHCAETLPLAADVFLL